MCSTAINTLNKLDKIWKTEGMNIRVKIKILHSLVYSILLYGCETWRLSNKTLAKLEAFEMKAYRRILKITYRQRIPNIEVRARIDSLNMKLKRLTTIVIQRQLKWLGHVTRLHNERIPRIALYGLVEGSRPRGRPRETWIECLLTCARIERKEVRRMTADRQNWQNFVRNCDPWLLHNKLMDAVPLYTAINSTLSLFFNMTPLLYFCRVLISRIFMLKLCSNVFMLVDLYDTYYCIFYVVMRIYIYHRYLF